jgi:hypothetical protein
MNHHAQLFCHCDFCSFLPSPDLVDINPWATFPQTLWAISTPVHRMAMLNYFIQVSLVKHLTRLLGTETCGCWRDLCFSDSRHRPAGLLQRQFLIGVGWEGLELCGSPCPGRCWPSWSPDLR